MADLRWRRALLVELSRPSREKESSKDKSSRDGIGGRYSVGFRDSNVACSS